MNLSNLINSPNLTPEGITKATEEVYRVLQDIAPMQRNEILYKVFEMCKVDLDQIRKEAEEICKYCDNASGGMSTITTPQKV